MVPKSCENQNARCHSLPAPPAQSFHLESVPGLARHENTLSMPVHQAKLVSTSSPQRGCSWPSSLSFNSRMLFVQKRTLGFVILPSWGCISEGPSPKEILLSMQRNALSKSQPSQQRWPGNWNVTPGVQCGAALRSGSQAIHDAHQGFSMCPQLPLSVASAPRASGTSSFRASVLCCSPQS